MARVTSLLLLAAGAVVLVTWLVSPAASAPPQAAPPRTTSTLDTDIAAIDQEVDRLNARLPDVPLTAITRDPFQFASPMPEPDALASAAPDDAMMPQLSAPPIAWPRLIAILSSGTDEQPTRQAVFEDLNQIVQIKSVGETIDGVRVDAITADAVTVTVPSSEQTTRLSIR